jgi:hypothetical protein
MNELATKAYKIHRRSKVRPYGWTPVSGKGRYQELDKNLLSIDHDYQRKEINETRVLDIRRNWSWAACGTLSVARRPDGTYWVYDGQHRLLAAQKLDSVQELPCLVFDFAEVRQEARSFVDTNTVRGPMKSVAQFRARIKAEDANALRMKATVEELGYKLGGASKQDLRFIGSLEAAYLKDREAMVTALLACKDICDDDAPVAQTFRGLFALEVFLKQKGETSISSKTIQSKLEATSQNTLLEYIRQSATFHGKGGDKVYADGIVRFINKHRRMRLPSPMGT